MLSARELTPVANLQRRRYMRIVLYLWQHGPEKAHQEYNDISVEEFTIANQYYDSLRCEGCFCGSCVDLPKFASNLNDSPKELEPIAKLARRLGEEDLKAGK